MAGRKTTIARRKGRIRKDVIEMGRYSGIAYYRIVSR